MQIQTQKIPLNFVQICAFQATEGQRDDILNALKEHGYEIVKLESGVVDDVIELPIGAKAIRYNYESDLYGEGLGALDFSGSFDQGFGPIKLAELVSINTNQRIHATEQYVGDHGVAVEVTICLKGDVLHRYNSDETFDHTNNYN